MTLPSSWPWPTQAQFVKEPIAYLDPMYRSISEEVALPSWRISKSETVAPAATTLAIVVDLDRLPYQVFATPSWGTTVFVTAKTVTGFTINFGTAAPGGGGDLDWWVLQQEAGP